jgi:hypothetical protein
VRITLVLLACLGLCSCALAPDSDDLFYQPQYVAPIVGHQEYVTPLPPGAAFEGLASGVAERYIGSGPSSPIPRMFAPPQPPFSY